MLNCIDIEDISLKYTEILLEYKKIQPRDKYLISTIKNKPKNTFWERKNCWKI